MKKSTSGFTIVELLIVIVVIAILAAISIVAYTGIQDRARLSKMQSDFQSISRAVEIYKVDNGVFPDYPTAVPSDGCSFTLMLPLLSSVSGLPAKNPQGTDILYVRGSGASTQWAVLFQKADGTSCKMGQQMWAGWWSNAPNCW